MWGGVGATSEERRPTIEIPTHYDTNKIFTASCESIFLLLGAVAETIIVLPWADGCVGEDWKWGVVSPRSAARCNNRQSAALTWESGRVSEQTSYYLKMCRQTVDAVNSQQPTSIVVVGSTAWLKLVFTPFPRFLICLCSNEKQLTGFVSNTHHGAWYMRWITIYMTRERYQLTYYCWRLNNLLFNPPSNGRE